MTVAELIQRLQKFPQNATTRIITEACTKEYIQGVYQSLDQENNPVIIIMSGEE